MEENHTESVQNEENKSLSKTKNKNLLMVSICCFLVFLLMIIFFFVQSSAKRSGKNVIAQKNSTNSHAIVRFKDYSTGNIIRFKNYVVPVYITADQSICNIAGLAKAFGQAAPNSMAVTPYSLAKPIYGEKNWWFTIKGTIKQVEKTDKGIAYSLNNGITTVKILGFPESTRLLVEKGLPISSNRLLPGDDAEFRLTTKCGGGKPALLSLVIIDSQKFASRLGNIK